MDTVTRKIIDERATLRRITIRLIPFLALLYLLNSIDRANVSIAALTMNKSLSMSATVFGIGSGIFFMGYVTFAVPSNLILERLGARIWICRIMVAWGLVSAATSLISGPVSFYAARFILGVAEAGFFPGMIFFLTLWYPARYRAGIVGLFMVAYPLSSAIGSPLSSFILVRCDGLLGIEGWRWMFPIEGVPAALAGLACLIYLDDRPAKAKWLPPAQRDWLESVLAQERRQTETVRQFTLLEGLTDRRVLLLCLMFLFVNAGLYGSMFWIPQVIKVFVPSDSLVGPIASVPYFCSALVMYFWARHSDATGERIWHLVATNGISALGFVITGIWLADPVVAIGGLILACVGIYATMPVFWTLPTAFLTGRAAAGALGLIISCANSAGIIVSPLIGWSKDATGGFNAAMFGLAGVMATAALLCLVVKAVSDRTGDPLPARHDPGKQAAKSV